MTALEELYLGNTSLSNLPAGLFDNSPLTYIDLSDNALTAIEKNYLASHPNPENIAVFNITGNDVADGEGWEITDASWQSEGSEFAYQLTINHALPADLLVSYTVVNGTVGGETTGSVTIDSGSTTSQIITVLPSIGEGASLFTLASNSTPFTAWSGHIAASSLEIAFDDSFCSGIDSKLLANLVSKISSASSCFGVNATSLGGITGQLNLFNKGIAAIVPQVTQALTGVSDLRLISNDLTQIPAESFANLNNLQQLHLSNNDITSIGQNAFANIPKVYWLNLLQNDLTEVPADLYSNHQGLQFLDLEDNKITSVAVDAFVNLPKIQRIGLQHNEINELPAGIFNGIGPSSIRLSYNNLTDLPLNLLQNHTARSSIGINFG